MNEIKVSKAILDAAYEHVRKLRDREAAEIADEGHTNRAFETALYQHLYNEYDRIFEPVVMMIAETNAQLRECKTAFRKGKPAYAQFKDGAKHTVGANKNADKTNH